MPCEKIVDRDSFYLKTVELGTGPTALVVGSHTYYPRTFSKSLSSKLRLIFADTRGFVPASSYHTESDFTRDKITEDIEAIRASWAVDQVILVGHSIHAFMALEYACRFPDRVSHLVLIASSPLAGHEIYKEADRYFEESVCPQRKEALITSMKKFLECKDSSFIERMLAFGPRLWYDHTFDASKLWADVPVNAIGAGIIWGHMFEDYDVAHALGSITCPIFLALGRYDYFNPPHLWESYRWLAADLILRVFEKSSHTPQFEEPENFDQELLRWLASKSEILKR